MKLPTGHALLEGREYVAVELFEAANRHVAHQGEYHNTLIATLNKQGARIRALEAERDRLRSALDDVRGELCECRKTQAAMRAAVYGAMENL